jgi:hypothetical protein
VLYSVFCYFLLEKTVVRDLTSSFGEPNLV